MLLLLLLLPPLLARDADGAEGAEGAERRADAPLLPPLLPPLLLLRFAFASVRSTLLDTRLMFD